MTEKSFTIRSLAIGLIFGSLVAMANSFLMLTIPIMITAAMVSVVALFAYSSFFRAPPPSPKEAVSAYTVHQAAAFAFSIFPIVWVFLVAYDIPRAVKLGIPDWILPDETLYGEVLVNGEIFSRSWITPLAWMLPVAIVSGIGALMAVIWLRNHYIKDEALIFPEAQADIQLIKGLTTEKYKLDYLFYGLALGFFFDFIFLQYPTSLGAAPEWLRTLASQIQLLDFTPYLTRILPGATLSLTIGLGLLGLGMLMSPKTSFNMAGSAVVFYIIVSALLVSRGTIEGSAVFSSQWSTFRFPYGLSLSVGLLLTAALGPLILKAASPLISGTKWKWKPSLRTAAVFVVFCLGILLLSMILSMDRFVTIYPLDTSQALWVGVVVLAWVLWFWPPLWQVLSSMPE
ncbi:MAG: OPT/YSL family transporter [Theionarchaea archaeon]|nr:OPT/YSL family transporter [Theionarchaea archaeon]